MNANGVPIPMDESLRLSIATDANASVLARMDSEFLHVLTSASHVSMYRLEAKNWERHDVEGSTFIYSRNGNTNGNPEYRIFCLNRRSTDNFCLDITPGLTDIELVNDKMIAFPGPDGQIFGMWFYVQQELQMFHEAFAKIAQGLHVPPLPRRSSGNTAAKNSNNGNGKKESPKKKARNPSEPKHQHLHQPTPATEHNNTSAANAAPANNAVPGFSLQRFFPNLQPTANGVIGAAIPAKAHDVTVAEASTVKPVGSNGSVPTGQSGESTLNNVSFGQYSASLPLQPAAVTSIHNNAVPNGRSEPETNNSNSNAAFMNLFQGKPMPAGSPPVQNVMGGAVSGPMLVPNNQMGMPTNPLPMSPRPMMSPPIVPGVPGVTGVTGANGTGVGHPGHSMPMVPPGIPGVPGISGIPGMPGMHPAHFQALQVQQQQHAHMAYLAHQRAQQQGRIPNRAPFPPPPPHVIPNMNMMPPVLRNGVVPPQGGIPNGNGAAAPIANGHTLGSNGLTGDALLGMLKPNSVVPGVKSPEQQKANGKPVEASARDIGMALAAMKLDGENSSSMSKAEFRAVVQRMLSDKKLFDSAYGTYLSVEKK